MHSSSKPASLLNRRAFGGRTVAAALGATAVPWLAGPAHAQGAPVEGQHYVKLTQPAPKATPAGKIDVVEFFMYSCPHCNALEPYLEPWIQRQPPDVVVRRSPFYFNPMQELHARVFYALEAMGLLEKMHRRVFAAYHVDNNRLMKEEDVLAFVKAQGVDPAKFGEMLKSFSVQTKLRQGKQLSEAYRIDGVPAIGVQGRWYTSAAMAGGFPQALAAASYLIEMARKSA